MWDKCSHHFCLPTGEEAQMQAEEFRKTLLAYETINSHSQILLHSVNRVHICCTAQPRTSWPFKVFFSILSCSFHFVYNLAGRSRSVLGLQNFKAAVQKKVRYWHPQAWDVHCRRLHLPNGEEPASVGGGGSGDTPYFRNYLLTLASFISVGG